MKKIDVTFFTWARCSIRIEVPDEYELPSSHPYEFWEDLVEKYPDQIETDIMTDEFDIAYYDGYEIDIDQMGLDYIDSIEVTDSNEKVVLAHEFEKIIYDDYYYR